MQYALNMQYAGSRHLTILGGMPWLGSGEDHVEKVCVWPWRPPLPWPSPHAVVLVPRDPGGEKYLYLWPTLRFLSGLNPQPSSGQ